MGAGPSKRLHVYQDLESRVTLKDLLDHGDQSFGSYIPGSSSGDLHVPQDHWFCLIRRYASRIVLHELLRHNDCYFADNQSRSKSDLWTARAQTQGFSTNVRPYVTAGLPPSDDNTERGSTMSWRRWFTRHNPANICMFMIRLFFFMLSKVLSRADSFPLLRRFPDWLSPWRVAARKLHERCVPRE